MNEIWRLLCRGGIGLEGSITSKWRVADLREAALRVGPGRGDPPSVPPSLRLSPPQHSGPGDTLQWGLHSASQRLQAHPCPSPLDASMTTEDAQEPDCEPLVLSEDSQAAAWVQIPVLCSGASSPSSASFQFLICKMGMNVNN